jgi:hypothetical protein
MKDMKENIYRHNATEVVYNDSLSALSQNHSIFNWQPVLYHHPVKALLHALRELRGERSLIFSDLGNIAKSDCMLYTLPYEKDRIDIEKRGNIPRGGLSYEGI